MTSNTGRMSLSVPVDKQAKLDAIAASARRSRSYIVIAVCVRLSGLLRQWRISSSDSPWV